jgi:transmembrane sensor
MNTQIREAAAQWLVEFRTETPGVGARRQFAAWLCTSPEHIRAYLDVLAVWEDARCYDRQRRVDIDALVACARTDHKITDLRPEDGPDFVVDAPGSEKQVLHASVSRKPSLRRHLGLRTAIAVLLSLLINGAVTWFATDSHGVAYTTQTAEQRSVPLTDGSRVDLDALSNVRANFTSHERAVELQTGQALFRVSKDPLRPFVVRVNDVRVRAVGTEFNVNRTALSTVVTVLEGRVAVIASPSSAEAVSVTVDAGQQTTIMGGTIAVPQAVDATVATGWTRGLLSFVATPLPEVAEEFNRFNSRRLVIASRELFDFRVTGTFRASNPESLADFVLYLRKQPGIEVLEKGDQITVQARAAG